MSLRWTGRLCLALVLTFLVGACGGDDGVAGLEAEPDNYWLWGEEAAVGQPIDLDGLVVTVTEFAASDADPPTPNNTDGAVDVTLEVENTTSEDVLVPSPVVFCEQPGADHGLARPEDLLVEPVAPGAFVAGEVIVNVPRSCNNPSLGMVRLGPPATDIVDAAHLIIPEDALP